jgi:hypothetical protein
MLEPLRYSSFDICDMLEKLMGYMLRPLRYSSFDVHRSYLGYVGKVKG